MSDPREPVEPGPDVAALGLAAAASVVERILELSRSASAGWRVPLPPNADPAARGDAPSAPSADPAERAKQARRFRADAERLVEVYAEWTRTIVDQATAFADQAEPNGASGSAGSVLLVGPAAAGSPSHASAWLHILDGPAAAPAPLHATTLVAHDGGTIAAAAVTFAPSSLDTAAARTSSEVVVTVAVPVGTAPGTYHGHVLATGLAEVALPLRVEVVA